MKLHVTQAEIARKVGISQQAVSYVLGNHSSRSRIRVRSEVRQRVLRTARRLGYRPNRLAQAVRRGRSGVIGMVSFHGSSEVGARRTFFAAKCIHEAGYRLLSTDIAWYAHGIEDAFHAMFDARVEGVILTVAPDWLPAATVRQVRELGAPMVSLSGVPIPGVAQVRADVRQGMALLARHLLGLGHRRLTLVTRPASADAARGDWTIRDRTDGLRDAVEGFGHGAADAVVTVAPPENAWSAYESGVAGLRKVLRGTPRPDAVLCSNDEWALGALRACFEQGVRVPRDLAVTGFDGSSVGEYCTPPLTTVVQPVEEIARQGVSLLLRQIEGGKLPPKDRLVKLPCRLLVRQSCGAGNDPTGKGTP